MKKLSKTLIVLALPVFIFSCSESATEKDEQMCKCLNASKEYSDFNSTLMNEDRTPDEVKKARRLAASQKKECKKFEMMSGPEARKLRELCKK